VVVEQFVTGAWGIRELTLPAWRRAFSQGGEAMAANLRRSLLTILCLAAPLATGCNVLEVPFILFGPEPSVPPEMKALASPDKKKEVKVLILTYSGSETRTDFTGFDAELSTLMAANLREYYQSNREKVSVISTKKVERFKQDHPNWKGLDLGSIGRRKEFDADYVIYVELDPRTLALYERGNSLQYVGTADATVTLVDVNDPDDGTESKEKTFKFPGQGKTGPDVNEMRPNQFRQVLARYMAKKLAWCFIPHTVKQQYHEDD
jgi:hypothetical protein